MSFFKGLLEDEEFLVAAGLLQQGSQGKGIGEAIFPAIAQAGQVKKLFGEKKKRATIKGADGYNYFVDTGERVLPDVVKTDTTDKYYLLTDQQAADADLDISGGQKYQLNITKNKIEPLKTKVDQSTNVQIKMPSDQQESSFAKGVGEGQAKEFNDIIKNSNAAANENIDLELITTAANNLETGKAAPLLADLMKWGQSFGIDVSWLSDLGDMNTQIANTEVINVLSGNQLFGKIQQTKGSISEKEMDIFESLTTSLSMSPDGLKNNAKIMQAINDREILKAEMAEEWVSNDDGTLTSLLKKKEVDGKMMTFNQMWNNYVNAEDENGELINPIISKELKDEMLDLANTNLKEMENNPNFIQSGGSWYYIIDEEKKIFKKLK